MQASTLRSVTRGVDDVLDGAGATPDPGLAAVGRRARHAGALDGLHRRVQDANDRLVARGADAADVLRWAAGTIPRFAATSSFGVDSAVLLHLLSRHAPDTPVIFLDTGLHFPETLAHRDRLAEQFGLDVISVTPSLTVEDQRRLFASRLSSTDPDTCCMLRKDLPLTAALAAVDGWATGVRRGQTASRADVPLLSTTVKGDRTLVKVAPLATWTPGDVADYRRTHDLPAHPLEAKGYRSIGCWPCTRPTAPDEDARAGRWADSDRTECGIHVDSDGRLVRTDGAAS
ncbi:phosphoadenylyl-sulfate reductase [Salsipaludibacter albus]|uniref:phosphoadenylyl-sulfate reductase n=1 Tax=Salsipaludibacter albus TaxID=2849650 RepID=UPI001EE3D7D6|nr:phosphoadenylyl-sulfate reductase [Salsipaludibacter albus]